MNTYPSLPLSYDLEEGSKTGLPAKDRLGAFGWRRTINDTYFDLQVSFVQPQSFFGSLNQVGLVKWACLITMLIRCIISVN